MADIGHNSNIESGQLTSFVERIESRHADRDVIAEDIRDIFAEAKSAGFDTKILKKIIAYRRQDAAVRAEEGAIFDLYLSALGTA